MADELKATPRSPILGLFSDIVNLPLQYMSAPERTQQSQGVAQFLYSTGIPKTLERASYGESLFSGAGGLGGTTRMRPETAEALVNVAPFLPKGIRATKDMPVGLSIKPINLNKGIYKPELTMEEMLKVKDIPTVERVQKSIDLVGEKEFENMVKAQFKKYKPTNPDTEAMLVESVTLDILGRAQRSPYPQQAALDLAQQRAALPVSEGGLGLPPNNTAMDRAKAMGFDVEGYHATNANIKAFDPNYYGASDYGTIGQGVYIDPSKNAAYSNLVSRITGKDKPTNIMPLMVRSGNVFDASELPLINSAERSKAVSQNLQNMGYDSVLSTVNGMPNEMVIFDPSRIRSRFAAFDPFRKDVATATAMGVALPDLLAQPIASPQPDYETTPMYFDPFGNTIGSSIR